MNKPVPFALGPMEGPEGDTYRLFKFDVTHGVGALGGCAGCGRVEYACDLMTRAAGIKMTEYRLHIEGPRAPFMTNRFDRLDDGDKVHIQMLAANV